ncbi:MAG: DUF2975 domain-containing protein [bacterium]|nr:DUF2975 domain-containing protein [bacterium]
MKQNTEAQTTITKVTKFLLDFMFYCGILACVTLPFTIRAIAPYYDKFEEFYLQAVILYFIDGVLAVLLVNELRRMFKTVLNDDCFIQENVVSLQRMGNFAFAIAAVSTVRMFFYITPAILVVILVFIVAGMFSKVLSQVFDRAVSYKLENDLTI